MRFFRLIFSFFLFCAPVFAQNKAADLVIINAKVRTMDAALPQAEAIAVRENKIIAVLSVYDIFAVGAAIAETAH